jgi:hypothetical protein
MSLYVAPSVRLVRPLLLVMAVVIACPFWIEGGRAPMCGFSLHRPDSVGCRSYGLLERKRFT